MGSLFLLVVILMLLAVFNREILLSVILFITRSKRIEPGQWDVRVSVQTRSIPRIFLHESSFLEALSVGTFWGSFVMVHKDLWELWTHDERECFLAWVASMNLRTSPWKRIFFPPPVSLLDRDVVLTTTQPLSFPSLLQKTIYFRESYPPSFLGTWLAGLSLLGPSFLGDWPTHDERLRGIASYLAELTKSQ